MLAFSAGLAPAAGNYQRTKDGKVTVWNGDPKPGDAARWFGGHDKDGYASGVGTLIWYTGDGQVYASYHGKMVRGKLDGPVDSRSGRKVAHAVFANGERTTRWAPHSTAKAAETVREQTSQVATARSQQPTTVSSQTPTVATATTAKPETTESRSPDEDHGAANPVPQVSTAEPLAPKIEPTPIAAASARGELSKTDVPAEGPPIDKEKTVQQRPGAEAGTPIVEKPEQQTEGTPLPEATRPTVTIQDKPEVADFSGPPPALRENSGAEGLPDEAAPEKASLPTGAELTSQEAMELADAEAHALGYDLSEYQRPRSDYSAVKHQWSFFYSSKDGEAGSDKAQHFLVTVDDGTKKAEVIR
jgi:hypothetical protein